MTQIASRASGGAVHGLERCEAGWGEPGVGAGIWATAGTLQYRYRSPEFCTNPNRARDARAHRGSANLIQVVRRTRTAGAAGRDLPDYGSPQENGIVDFGTAFRCTLHPYAERRYAGPGRARLAGCRTV